VKRYLSALLLAVVLALTLTAGAVSRASAATPDACSKSTNVLSCACSGSASGSDACSGSTSDPISGQNGVLKRVSLVLATIAGVAAIIVIIVGGIMYITSAGDASKAASARNTIIGAVVGLVIIAAAETIIVFVVNKV